MTWCSSSRAGVLLATLLVIVAAITDGHVPVPASVLDPKSPAEAWNVLRLSTGNVARLLEENRLGEIPEQIALCNPALRALPRWMGENPTATRLVAVETVQASIAINSLAQAGLAGDKSTAATAFASLRKHLDSLGSAYDPATVKADIFLCPMHPDVISASPSARCVKCGMSLVRRRIPYSFVYVPAGEPTIQLTARCDSAPKEDCPLSVTVRLSQRDGSPVVLSDLLVMHTQPIHLLIVDQSLEDYHHEHPVPTGVPGEYTFRFVPKTSASYRVFADIVPAETGVQELPWTDLHGASFSAKAPVHGPDALAATVDGINFQLAVTGTPAAVVRAREVCALRLNVMDSATGQPVRILEPVMAAFAHMVGFYDDHLTVVHLHPLGSETLAQDARGGPDLEFRFFPPKPGYLRLYCQVQIKGKAVFVPLSINVSP